MKNLQLQLIDTHCHLFMAPLYDRVDAVLKRARQNGIGDVIVPAYNLASWSQAALLSNREHIYCALGLHPWVADESLNINELKRELEVNQAVAVGEIGLDFAKKPKNTGSTVDEQRQVEVLKRQLNLALEMELPVIIHCRSAFETLFDILASYNGRLRGVVHAFSKGPQLAKRFVDLGFHIAFGGAVTRLRAEKARASVIAVPADKLLLETDAPSIGLDNILPIDTEPVHVHTIAGVVANLRGVTIQNIAAITTKNAKTLFKLK